MVITPGPRITAGFSTTACGQVAIRMGLVTDAEAAKATEFARRVSGVQRVVRLFELIAS